MLFVLPSIRTQRVLTLSLSFCVKSCCSYLAFTFSVDCAARCDASAQACCLAVLPCLACRPFFSVQLSTTTLSLSRVLQVCSRCMISCRDYRLRCAKLGQFKRWPCSCKIAMMMYTQRTQRDVQCCLHDSFFNVQRRRSAMPRGSQAINHSESTKEDKGQRTRATE